MNQEENTAAQAAQNQASDNIGAQQEVNNESAGKDCMPLTTENFHALLDANTAKQARLRTEYAKRLAYIQIVYDDDLDGFLALEHQANDKFHDARKAYEDAKEEYELDLRSLKKAATRQGADIIRTRLLPRTSGLLRTKRSRLSATTSSSVTEILGGTHGSRGRTPSSGLDQNQGRRSER